MDRGAADVVVGFTNRVAAWRLDERQRTSGRIRHILSAGSQIMDNTGQKYMQQRQRLVMRPRIEPSFRERKVEIAGASYVSTSTSWEA